MAQKADAQEVVSKLQNFKFMKLQKDGASWCAFASAKLLKSRSNASSRDLCLGNGTAG